MNECIIKADSTETELVFFICTIGRNGMFCIQDQQMAYTKKKIQQRLQTTPQSRNMYMKGSDELFSWRHIQVQSALKEMGGQLISSTLPSYSPQQFGIKNKPETQQQMN